MTRNFVICAVVLLLLAPWIVRAQAQEAEGKVSGNYNIQQAVEFGGRFTDINGNGSVYNTLVNLQSGPRLLEYTLSMRSLDHTGTLMDNLYTSSFGYGGDPAGVTRLRISKNKWYDFTGMFRRDQNYFDYNLLANPLNPPNTVVPNNISPHFMDTRRNMGDFNLTLAPQSVVRVRLGYSRNVVEGPSNTSFHEGTEIKLEQDYRNRSDRYQFGVDVKLMPRTTISFDQFFEHNKVDTSLSNSPFLNFVSFDPLVAGASAPVDLGLVYDPFYGQPCGTLALPAVVAPGTVNPACNIYRQYNRASFTRTDTPTSQLSIQSSYWKKLDITAQGSYSSSDLDMPSYNEFGRTLITRTNEVAFNFTGPANTERIETHADLGLTFHINDHWSLTNQFRWLNWRIPGSWASSDTACFANVAVGANIFTPPGSPGGAATCLGIPTVGLPAHVNSSGADFATDTFIRYLGEADIFNTSSIEWEPGKRFAAHLGYRYGNRYLKAKNFDFGVGTFFPVNPAVTTRPLGVVPSATDEIATEDLTQHSLLFGFHAMPYDGWRVNADLEVYTADNAFTRITPRNLQKFKVRSTYRVANWGSVSGSVNLLESRNGAPENLWPATVAVPRHKDHARSYNLAFTINPKDWIAVDLGYTFFDVLSTTGTCVPLSTGRVGGVATPVAIEGGPSAQCLSPGGLAVSTGSVPANVRYRNNTNSGFFNIMLKPVRRLAVTVGYDLTSDSGDNDWFRADSGALLRLPIDINGNVVLPGGLLPAVAFVNAPNYRQPLGPLGINWHKPSASVAFEVWKGLTAKAAWNHFGYNEKSLPGPSVARDFRANTGTVSMRYEF
ncbi:MAG TPA: hypothetical protein VN622_05690 [Clostridia bacterium]|nr:hypothetical protein [Clostridia bacterium]